MVKAKSLFQQMRGGVERTARKQLNKVLDAVNDFESQGGVRGAYERARVRTERQAQVLFDVLEARGIKVDLGRFIPPTSQQEAELRAHYRTIGVPYGEGLDVVKSAYRAKMREHHPDRHAGDPERERAETRISQELTIAYDAIEAHFKRIS